MKSLLLATAFLVFSSQVKAQESEYFEISSVNVFEEEISQSELSNLRQKYSDEREVSKKSENPIEDLDLLDTVIDKIFVIGAKIWKVVDANKPVVNLTTKRVSAIPEGVNQWLSMENWSDLQAKKLTVVYKNGFGSEVVRLSYLITYTYGGSVQGRGKFLSEVGFLVSNLDVAWGYKFNAAAEVARVQNVGTREDPIAAMELNFDWSVDTPLKHSQSAVIFYVRGDGKLTAQGM